MEDAEIKQQSNNVENAGEVLLSNIKRIVQSHVDKVEEFKDNGVVTTIRQQDESRYVVLVKGVTWCERGNRHHSTCKTAYCVDLDHGEFWPICLSQACKQQPPAHRVQHDLGLFKFLLQGDIGWSRIIALTLRDTVKVTDRKSGEAYVYDPHTGLWEHKFSYGVLLRVSAALTTVRDRYISELERQLQKEVVEKTRSCIEEKMSDINGMYLSFLTSAKLSSAYKLAVEPLYVPNFGDTMNKAYPHLFPIRGRKVIDLRNGQIGELCKEHLFCFAGPRMYIPKKNYPEIEKLLSSVMCGNASNIQYLRLKMGLFLTGEILREIDEWSGDGRNGKSTFYKLLQEVMGLFFALIPKDIVIANKFGSSAGAASPEWFTLIHARVAFFDEVEEGEQINTRNVKRLANGDPTRARGLYQGDYTLITPRCKVVICVNKDLIYDSTDKAMTDRMVITPWPANFERAPEAGSAQQKQDDSFIQNIIDHHLDDLFSYMVDAAIDFYKNGKVIEHPLAVLEKTAEVNKSMDSVTQFVDECCAFRPPDVNPPQHSKDEDYKVRPADLFAAYMTWLNTQGMTSKKIGRVHFPKVIEKMKGVTKRKFAGNEFWVGLKMSY